MIVVMGMKRRTPLGCEMTDGLSRFSTAAMGTATDADTPVIVLNRRHEPSQMEA
jgi:hypothetical protein